MNKAQFKATREQVGYSQQAIADLLGCNIRTVKRWEQDIDKYNAPAAAWEILNNALKKQREMVDYALEVAQQQERELGAKPREIKINYYRNQEMFDARGRDSGYFGVANANARATAERLNALGFTVRFYYA